MRRWRARHKRVWLGGAFLLCLSGLSACRNPQRGPPPLELPSEVTQHIPAHRPFDRRPYEFIWANRQPDFHQWMDFERSPGWRVEASEGVDASWDRSQAVQLWEEYVGAFTFSSSRAGGQVLIHFSRPPRLLDPVDTVTVWLHGTDPSPEGLVLALHISDASGESFCVPVGEVDGAFWRLAHVRLPSALTQPERYPLSLTALEWSRLPVTEGMTLYVDGLSAFKDALEPVRHPVRPRRPLTQWPGPLPGMNRGHSSLPFPTRDTTIIPGRTEMRRPFSMERKPNGVLRVQRTDTPGQPRFELRPDEGLFPLIAQLDDDVTVPLLGALHRDGVPLPAEPPVVIRHRRDHVYIEYAYGLIVELSLYDATLVLDLAWRGGDVKDLTLVTARDPERQQALHLPYLHVADEVAPVWMQRDAAQPVFSLAQFDPYRSNASALTVVTLDGQERISARYNPTTGGRRNDLHERLVVSVARELDAVLPTVPNPVAGGGGTLFGGMVDWREEEAGYSELLGRARRLEAIGARDLCYVLPERIWREQHDSVAFRRRTNPYRGGDAAVIDFIQSLRALGATVALPIKQRTLSPLNAFWHPDRVLRGSDGKWLSGPDGTFVVKPGFALSWSKRYSGELVDRFNPDHLFLSGHFSEPPWHATDYDQRAPASGSFAQTFYADGDLLAVLRLAGQRPVFADARSPRWVVGLADALLHSGDAVDARRPFNPVFKLWRLHGLSPIVHAPLFDAPGENMAERLDGVLGEALAYGSPVLLWADEAMDDTLVVRNLFALRALWETMRKAPKPRMLWAGRQGYIAVEEALHTGVLQDGRLYVRYDPDLEIWVNGGSDTWPLWAAGQEWRVPPSGWLALGSSITALSLEQDGARMDYVAAPGYLYFDGRGKRAQYGLLQGRGPVVVWRDSEQGVEVIDVSGQGGVAVHRDAGIDFDQYQFACFDRDGTALGPGHATYEAPWWHLSAPPGARRWIAVSP